MDKNKIISAILSEYDKIREAENTSNAKDFIEELIDEIKYLTMVRW